MKACGVADQWSDPHLIPWQACDEFPPDHCDAERKQCSYRHLTLEMHATIFSYQEGNITNDKFQQTLDSNLIYFIRNSDATVPLLDGYRKCPEGVHPHPLL